MTDARAARYRAERIENRRPSRKEIREERNSKRWTIDALWHNYEENHAHLKGLQKDRSRYTHDLEPVLGKKEPGDLRRSISTGCGWAWRRPRRPGR